LVISHQSNSNSNDGIEVAMPTITQISEHPRKPGRYIIDVDGKEFAVVNVDVLTEAKVKIGVVIDDVRAAQLREASDVVETYDRALNLLAFRARSARELGRRLMDKGASAACTEKVIEKLRDVGLIDDADFARQVARSKVSGGASKRRLHQELFKRGVARDVADAAVTQVLEEEDVDQVAVAERVARKRLPSLASADAQSRRRRLYSFLARRGHDSETIRVVMQRVLDDAAGAGDAEGADDREGAPG
jgi:regulatory protein